jgi:hypothetical protein
MNRRHLTGSVASTWDQVLAALRAEDDAVGELDWRVSVDSTASRVDQHGRAGNSPCCRCFWPNCASLVPIGRRRAKSTALRGDQGVFLAGTGATLRRPASSRSRGGDRVGHRKCSGSRAGRPVGYDVEDYMQRKVVERFFDR